MFNTSPNHSGFFSVTLPPMPHAIPGKRLQMCDSGAQLQRVPTRGSRDAVSGARFQGSGARCVPSDRRHRAAARRMAAFNRMSPRGIAPVHEKGQQKGLRELFPKPFVDHCSPAASICCLLSRSFLAPV
jgi:hypothetical protein